MCVCQSDSITFTTIDTCPSNFAFVYTKITAIEIDTHAICNHLTCKNGGTCMPYAVDEPSCARAAIGSACCQCKEEVEIILNEI